MRAARTILLVVACLALILTSTASADPLPGEVLKFIQLPLNGGIPTPVPLPGRSISGAPAPFPGHDELSTAWRGPNGFGFAGQFMADDFSDNLTSPIVHVQWWGSYMNQSQPGTVPAF